MRPETLLEFLMELDAIRQPVRFGDFLKACEADSRGRTGLENCALPETDFIVHALEVASSIDAGAIAKQHVEPEAIKKAVFEARLAVIKQIY
jgi:tRNA nucleotidyltransferase (CCA-adding enzyme)